jgi:hypothetical protein
MKFLQAAPVAVVLRSLPISLLFFLLMLYALLRVALLMYTGTDLVPVSSWPLVLLKGLWFDLVVAVTLVAPVLLYEALLPDRWRASAWHSKLRCAQHSTQTHPEEDDPDSSGLVQDHDGFTHRGFCAAFSADCLGKVNR